MQSWTARILVLGLLVLIVGLPFIWRPAGGEGVGGAASQPGGAAGASLPGGKLVVVSPHNEQIRYEIDIAFDRWHRAHYGQWVEIDWRNVGGTSQIVRQLVSQYTQMARSGQKVADYDVVFGGGDIVFDKGLKPGLMVNVGGKNVHQPILQPIALESGLLKEVFPSQMIGDRQLYDPQGSWYGVVLASFGIIYNKDVLATRGLPEPKGWADLARPEYRGWVALADPNLSGSVRATYDALLQRMGAVEGLVVLKRACANSRYFADSSGKVPADVANGEAAAGMCIDSSGRYEVAQFPGRVVYFSPRGQTLVSADPVAVLWGAPHRELAERFVTFLLSEEGQGLWNLPIGHRLGPTKYPLCRPPVRRDMYTKFAGQMVSPEDPFEVASPAAPGTPSYYDSVAVVMQAMAINLDPQLKAAWEAIQRADPARKAAMEAEFDALPFSAHQLAQTPARWKADPGAMLADKRDWTEFFRQHYQKVVWMGE